MMRGQVGAIAELARDLEGTTEILERLRLLLADRNQTLDGEMAAIQVRPSHIYRRTCLFSRNAVHAGGGLLRTCHPRSSQSAPSCKY